MRPIEFPPKVPEGSLLASHRRIVACGQWFDRICKSQVVETSGGPDSERLIRWYLGVPPRPGQEW
jgi:hypothetical protein